MLPDKQAGADFEMKRACGTIGAVALAAILIGSGVVFWRIGLGFNLCRVDSQVSASDRAVAAQASTAFIALVRAGETTAALEATTGRESAERAALLAMTEESLATPGGAPQVRHTYSLWSVASPNGYASCDSAAGTAHVARGGGPHTLFTIVAEPIQGGERAWTFWLEHERSAWRVRGVHVGLSAMAGRDGAALWALAEAQRQANNVFNSTLLYDLAHATLYRGGFLQPPEANGFAEARRMWRRHQDVIQARFHLGEQTFPIAGMHATSTGDGAFVLVLDQALELPVAVPEAIRRNRALIDGMNVYRPEWREVFDALAAGAPTGPNRLWRTVYRRDGGYLPEPPEAGP